MSIKLIALIVLGLLLIAWLGWTAYVRLGVKEPSYTVLEKKDGYEIRQYEPYIVAYTDVDGSYRDALTQGFRIVANYIFGGNTKKESIAMTTPVMETEALSEKIAMTVPVTEETIGEKRRISFVMPAEYTLETLPTPNDERVQLAQVLAKKYAVLRFGWYPTEKRVEAHKAQLVELVQKSGLNTRGEPIFAGYNDPWSFPLLFRNEILIEIE